MGDVETMAGTVSGIVGDLTARPGGDIGVHASITLARSLLAADLVDELHLAVGPVLDPTGRWLFDGLEGLRRLDLTSATATSAGSLWVSYRVPGRRTE